MTELRSVTGAVLQLLRWGNGKIDQFRVCLGILGRQKLTTLRVPERVILQWRRIPLKISSLRKQFGFIFGVVT